MPSTTVPNTISPAEVAAIVVVCLALVRVAETTIQTLLRRARGANGKRGCNALSDEEHDMLARLDEMHGRYDADGTPLWYVPRSLADAQKDIAESMRKIAGDQRRIAETLDRIERRSEQTGRQT